MYIYVNLHCKLCKIQPQGCVLVIGICIWKMIEGDVPVLKRLIHESCMIFFLLFIRFCRHEESWENEKYLNIRLLLL